MSKTETEELLLDFESETLHVDGLEVNAENTNIMYLTATIDGVSYQLQIESDTEIKIVG
jgi:hypothetical protein